jgi:hypothetical protein
MISQGKKMASKRKSESGQVMVLAAGAMILIIGMAALAVDVGFLYATRRNMQTVADAAAIAGSNALKDKCGTSPDCTCESQSVCAGAGHDVATLNGYTTTTGGSSPVTVTLKTPASAPSPTNGVYVEADVTQPVPTYFLRALGYDTMTVSTTAIAGYDTAPNCVYVKDPSGSETLLISGSGSIHASCGLLVASTTSDGMHLTGGAAVCASTIGVDATGYTGGGITSCGSSTCGASTSDCPTTGVAPQTDPLAYLLSEEPTPGACVTGADQLTATGGHGGTINPGTYCNGINVSGGATLNLNPGLYILNGAGAGGKSLNVSASNLNGTGVTFYNTGTSRTYGQLNISGSGIATLSAPTSAAGGGIPGVLFFQDPLNTQIATVNGSGAARFQGALYFPGALLNFSGGSSTNTEQVTLDAWKMNISGSAYVGAASSSPGQTPAITTSRLYK